MASSSQFIITMESSPSTHFSSSTDDNSSSDGDQEMISQHYNKRVRKITNLLLPPQMLTLISKPVEKQYIRRDHEGSDRQIWRDYFAENCMYPPNYFRRRFRMRRELFLRILNDVKGYDKYFVQKKRIVLDGWDALLYKKITVAIRILAYGFLLDRCDEYIKIGETTANDSLKLFCDAIIALYKEQYLHSPNENDIARLLEEGKAKSFPGMLGSLDCMYWE
ncbi:hypothetical protein ACSBR2_024733 [Camellia fascicularis]